MIYGGAKDETIEFLQADSQGTIFACGTSSSMDDYIGSISYDRMGIFAVALREEGFPLWSKYLDSTADIVMT